MMCQKNYSYHSLFLYRESMSYFFNFEELKYYNKIFNAKGNGFMTHTDVLVYETIYYYSSLTLHFGVTICINPVFHHRPYWELSLTAFLFLLQVSICPPFISPNTLASKTIFL